MKSKVSLPLPKLIIFFACIVFGLTGCEDVSQTPVSPPKKIISELPFSPDRYDWPHSASDLSPDSDVRYGRLKNGLRYAILPKPDESGVVSIHLNMSVGWNDEPEDAYGVAHLLEHIAFRGKRGGGETPIIHELQTDGVGFGRDFNGFTSAEHTNYYVSLTNPNSKSLSNALESFKELVDVSALSPDILAKEKKIVIAELNRRNTVQDQARQSYHAFLNPQNARAKVDGIGTAEGITKISIEQVLDFHTEHYIPENAFLVIVGGVELNKTQGLIRSIFSDWETSQVLEFKTAIDENIALTNLPDHDDFVDPAIKTTMRAVQHHPSTLANDLFSQRRATFMKGRIRSVFNLRLNNRVDQEPKVNWINVFNTQNSDHDRRGVRIGAKDYELAYRIFEEERRRLVAHGLTGEEFAFALKESRVGFVKAAKPSENIVARREASRIRKRFVNGEVYLNPQQELDLFEAFEVSVTKADLDNAAKKIWDKFNPRFSTQSSRKMNKTVERIKSTTLAMMKEPIERPSIKVETEFQKAEFAEIGRITSQDTLKSENVYRLLFDNGSRLNFKHSESADNEVLIAISLQPQSDEFLQYFAAIQEKLPSLSWADIAGMDKEGMERFFVGKYANFSLTLVGDRFLMIFSTTPDELKASLEVASTFLVNFDLKSKDHIEAARKQLDRTKTAMNRSPVMAGAIKMPSLYADDPPAFKSLSNNGYVIYLKRDKIIENIIETGAIDVGVWGDFDEGLLKKLFAETIGAMPPREPVRKGHSYLDTSISHISPNVETISYQGTKDQMALFFCWPLPSELSPRDLMEFEVLSDVVVNRLHAHIRDDLGLTYSVQKGWERNPVFPNFQVLCFSAQVEPKNEGVALGAFKTVIENIPKDPFKQSEFDRAMEPRLSLKDRMASNGYAEIIPLALAYSNDKYWKELKDRQASLEKIRLKSIRRLSQDFLNSETRSVFRVQKYESTRQTRQKTLLAKSYLGDPKAQYEVGVLKLKGSRYHKASDTEHAEGIDLLQKLGEAGNKQAYMEIGTFYHRRNELKLAVKFLALADDDKQGAYLLSSLYFNNFKVFPDVSDEHIIALARRSAENGFADGQFFFAHRLKDGTLTQRDEIGALKWALIANFAKSGELKLTKEKDIERFQTGLTEQQVEAAVRHARAWVETHKTTE